jgi:hypothetical protein
VTYGTIGFGFFRDTIQFRQKVLYWHIIPTSTELGCKCPGIPAPESMATYEEGSHIQGQMVLAAVAADIVKNRTSS